MTAATKKTVRYSRTERLALVDDLDTDRGDDLVEPLERDRTHPKDPALGARHVDDRGRLRAPRRPVVEDYRDRRTQHLLGGVGVRRRRLTGDVRTADREWARPRQQLEGDLVVGHPQGHRSTGVP